MHFSSIFLLLSLVGMSFQADYNNPLKDPMGSDPFIVTHGGYYYLMTTTWASVKIMRAKTLDGLKTGETKVIYRSTEVARCCYTWSPELWQFDGIWYVYFTAGTNENLEGQRIHVLTGGATPWDEFTYTGQVTPRWAIDATVLKTGGVNYLVWSCLDRVQSLCIGILETPTTLQQDFHILAEPNFPWEKVGAAVNEGPAALYAGGKVYLTYSASDCRTADYQLGVLTWDGTTSPLQQEAWSKSPTPIMSTANENYGTGHNGFFTSFDGKETWIVYHATARANGTCGAQRYTMAQKMEFNTDGSPKWPIIAPTLDTTFPGPSGEDPL